MAQQTINTVIVLRNDKSTAWAESSHVLLAGEVGISYLDNGNVIAKVGTYDGVNEATKKTWAELPQLEGVIEDEITLTHNFGRYKTSNGFVTTDDAKGKTVSEWLIHALSETKDPTVTAPTFALTADTIGGEIGSKVTKLTWYAKTGYGNYEYGPDTGLSKADRSWAISNTYDSQTATVAKGTADTTAPSASNSNTGTYKGTFTLTGGIQLTQEASKEYAKINGDYELDATNAAIPLNNIGVGVPGKKIASASGSKSASVTGTAYRKPFWGIKAAGSTIDIAAMTSAQVRALGNSGTSNGGLPTSLDVPVGTQQVIFAAKSGAKSKLVAKDTKAMNAEVSFTKVANKLKVSSANDYDDYNYDVWYVDFGSGVDAAMNLSLTWS